MAVNRSIKQLQIDKANTIIVVAVGVAAFTLTFSLITARSLLAKQSYQNRVVQEREKARDQLDNNIEAVDELKVKYTEFVSRQENIIKGNGSANGERDGDNARIVLDALPSKYDFPALVSSLEKILTDRSYIINSIAGIDQEATINGDGTSALQPGAVPIEATDPNAVSSQAADQTATTAVEMPFELIASAGGYPSVFRLLDALNNSIRPLKLRTVTLSAAEGNIIEISVTGHSYYQPERTLDIKEEVIQ